MATVEFLNKKIEGKKKLIEKTEKTIERINKAKATNWTVNPYWYSESDLTHNEKQLALAKIALEKYEEELRETIEKDNSRNVTAIIEFLEQWKNRVYDIYTKDFTEYYTAKADIAELRDSLREKYGEYMYCYSDEYTTTYKAMQNTLNERLKGKFEKREVTTTSGRKYTEMVKVENGDLEHIANYVNGRTEMEACDRLHSDLENEAKAKYDFIIERTNAICGTITDASYLKVSANGELNGIIIGERGRASVKTVGCGGYNIQGFHFRVLVHSAK